MGHSHAHFYSHSFTHRGRLTLTPIITTIIFIAEVIGAYWTSSLALLVDAGHMLVDVAGFVIAVTAASLTEKSATSEYTWGLYRARVPAAGAQVIVLLGVGTFAFIGGIERLIIPRPTASVGLLVFGIMGLVDNVVSILTLASGRGANLNMCTAFFEVVNDTLGSVVVIAPAAIVALTGWIRADVIAGMLIAVFIIPGAITIICEVGSILMESTPRGLDLSEVHEHLFSAPHVLDIHDLHAYEIATGLPVLVAHIVLADECFADGHTTIFLHQFQDCVTEHFPVSIEHSTFQFEFRTHAEHEISGYRH